MGLNLNFVSSINYEYFCKTVVPSVNVLNSDAPKAIPNANCNEERSSSVVGAPSTILEPPNVYKSRWRSIHVMYLTMFLSSISFTISMSSLWLYLKILDPSATTDNLGWVVAAYSVGQLVASPIFGKWANVRGKNREPLVVSIIINILANIVYTYLESLPEGKQYYLLATRAMIGFGAGNVAVVRSYVSEATTIKERTSAMANMSVCQAIGFIIGPGIQAALSPIGYPGPINNSAFHFNMYTSPAFVGSVVGVVNIILLFVAFADHRVHDDDDDDAVNFTIQKSFGDTGVISNYNPDYSAVVASISIFFIAHFIFAVFETIGTPLTMHMYAWSQQTATLNNSIILAVGGIVCILDFMVIKFLSRRIDERYLLMAGFLFCFAGFFIYLPWGNQYPPYEDASIIPNTPNSTTIPPHETTEMVGMANSLLKKDVASTTTVEPRGCPDTYAWCSTVPVVRLPQFLAGTFLIAVGYPTCTVISYTVYSKILGPKPQGTMMGWLTAAGSLARTIGPIFVGETYDQFGPRVTFASVCGLIIGTIIATILVFKKLVPFKFKHTGSIPSINNKTVIRKVDVENEE